MQFKIPHSGTRQQAIDRVTQLIEESRDKAKENGAEIETSWQDNVLTYSATAQGQHISGTLTVEDGEYVVYAKLPLTLRLFEGRIQKMIEQEVAKMRL